MIWFRLIYWWFGEEFDFGETISVEKGSRITFDGDTVEIYDKKS